ncbi:hypothetical protein D3C78_1770580 [compost metagenome]
MPSPPAPCAGLITKSLRSPMMPRSLSISFSVSMIPYISGTWMPASMARSLVMILSSTMGYRCRLLYFST